MARQDFAFFHKLRVRWSEVDMQAIVFNGNYLNYFDVAFTEYWRCTGLPNALVQAGDGQEFFARKAGLEYFFPAHFDDMLDIGVRCSKLGRSSMQMVFEIFRGDEHLISGELIYVYADTRLRKGIAIPDSWREIIHALEIIKPIGGN